MITVEVHNIHIKLLFDNLSDQEVSWIKNQIHYKLDPLDPNRYRIRTFNLRTTEGERVWDGRVKLTDLKDNIVPSGLFDELNTLLRVLKEQHGIDYQIVDQRTKKLMAEVPDRMIFKSPYEKTLILNKDDPVRGYQHQSVVNAFREQEGILKEATNGGKTLNAIAIFKLLLPKIKDNQHLLFIAPNKSIMNQVYKKFQHYIGEEYIGIWGDSKRELDFPIVCATIQTPAISIKKPKVKVTRKKDRLLERLATKYAPAILGGGDPRQNLKLLVTNFRPRYKYEADDVDVLKDLYLNQNTSTELKGCLEAYQRKYQKLLVSLDRDGFERYNMAVSFLESVVAVICDEAHSAGSDSYWNVFQYLNNARMRIGMTGTLDKSQPIRMKRIKALLGTPIINVTNKQLIDSGISAKPHIRMVPISKPADLDAQVGAMLLKQGQQGVSDLVSYQKTYELGVIHNDYRNALIAELAYKASLRLDKKAVLIIVNSIEHGELISQKLDQYTNNYEFIQGKDDSQTREQVFDKVRRGDLKILIGTKIMDMGIDIPNIQVYIECSAGKSYVALLQRIGRILRIMDDKKDVYVYDVIDKTSRVLWKHGKTRMKYYKEQGFDLE